MIDLTISQWIIFGVFYIIGVMLTIAAFGKFYSNEYVSEDSRYAMYAGSILIWPICLFFLACAAVYRKAYKR